MTQIEEKELNCRRDIAYLNKANNVWGENAKNFGKAYKELQEEGLYDGTSFQRKYYPTQYRAFIDRLIAKKKHL